MPARRDLHTGRLNFLHRSWGPLEPFDNSFPVLLKKAAGIEKGSGEPNRNKVAKVTRAQVREIAEQKMPDLNAHDVDQASKITEGTARSMGVEVTG